jgi:hypothetical protein
MIMVDFNESLGSDPRLMGSIFAAHDLFDVISNFHGDAAEIPTYIRGTKRLDYATASSSMCHLICACGYNLFNENIHSDHRASFVDLRLKDYFGHATPSLASPDLRFVSSSSPDIKQFIRKVHSHLRENKVFHSYQEFRLDREVLDDPWRMANQIDSLIGQAFHVAESSCYKPPKPPWSEKLHIASLKVRFWKTALTERLTRVPQSAVLHNLSTEIWQNTPPTIPTRTKILKSVGTAAQRAPRRIRKNTVKERERGLPDRTEITTSPAHGNKKYGPRRGYQKHRPTAPRHQSIPMDCTHNQTTTQLLSHESRNRQHRFTFAPFHRQSC